MHGGRGETGELTLIRLFLSSVIYQDQQIFAFVYASFAVDVFHVVLDGIDGHTLDLGDIGNTETLQQPCSRGTCSTSRV
jgi:hypothetical protein